MENKQNTIPNANLNGQEKRNVPTLRFPEFDKKWDYKQVKNILNICHGKDYKHLGKGEFPVLGTGGVITYVDNYICNWSCVLIGRKGTINKPQFMISPFWSVDTLFYSKPHNGQLPQFQYYLFQTINWEKYNEGSSVPSLSASTIENIQVHIPSTQEQQKISEFLSLIDQRIETQNKIINKYKTLIKGLEDYLFDGKGLQHSFKDLYVKAGEGGTPATDNKEYYEEGTIPFIKIENLNTKYIVKNDDYISELGLCKSSAWLVPVNSVIYSNGATIGSIAINKYPIATKQGILGIVPSKFVLTEYLYYYMQTTYFRKQIKRVTVRGTMDCAYLKDMNHIPCFTPSISEQRVTINILSSIDEKIDNERTILNKLKEQKSYLLSNLFI